MLNPIRMKHVDDGVTIFDDWHSRKCYVRAEFTAGNISVWFTGQVAYHSAIELILERDGDELSLSLFCAKWRTFVPPSDSGYIRVVVVETDGDTTCTLHEIPNDSALSKVDG